MISLKEMFHDNNNILLLKGLCVASFLQMVSSVDTIMVAQSVTEYHIPWTQPLINWCYMYIHVHVHLTMVWNGSPFLLAWWQYSFIIARCSAHNSDACWDGPPLHHMTLHIKADKLYVYVGGARLACVTTKKSILYTLVRHVHIQCTQTITTQMILDKLFIFSVEISQLTAPWQDKAWTCYQTVQTAQQYCDASLWIDVCCKSERKQEY
jgi:hypothetical protein